jgi:hypothetical protein
VEDEGLEKLGSEYEPQADEGCEEEKVNKVQILLHYTIVCIMSIILHQLFDSTYSSYYYNLLESQDICTGTRGSKRVIPPRHQCELGVTGLQEHELSGQDSFVAADSTKVLIPPIFQGLTFVCMLMLYI